MYLLSILRPVRFLKTPAIAHKKQHAPASDRIRSDVDDDSELSIGMCVRNGLSALGRLLFSLKNGS